jgi:hypothetical protein
MRLFSSRLTRAVLTLGTLTVFTLAAGCPEAEKKHEEITDEVGHAPKNQLNQVEQRLNNSAQKAAERLNDAAAAADKATDDEGGW